MAWSIMPCILGCFVKKKKYIFVFVLILIMMYFMYFFSKMFQLCFSFCFVFFWRKDIRFQHSKALATQIKKKKYLKIIAGWINVLTVEDFRWFNVCAVNEISVKFAYWLQYKLRQLLTRRAVNCWSFKMDETQVLQSWQIKCKKLRRFTCSVLIWLLSTNLSFKLQ